MKYIAVGSGKGGVGKSLVASLLASYLSKKRKTAILDADITGASITKLFGINERAGVVEGKILPAEKNGIQILSTNMLLESPTQPVIWRGPLISKTIKQFVEQTNWDADILIIDLPPGTSDASLTVMQSLKLDGMVIVTSPQEVVGMIVQKQIKMAKEMNVNILGIVENMAYTICPYCKKRIDLFGESKTENWCIENNINFLGQIPIMRELSELADKGEIYKFGGLEEIWKKIESKI